jgi:hypothetical protein
MLTLIRHLDPVRYAASVLIVHPVAEPLLSMIRAMGIPAQHLPARLVWDAPWYSRNNLQTGAWLAFAWVFVALYHCSILSGNASWVSKNTDCHGLHAR